MPQGFWDLSGGTYRIESKLDLAFQSDLWDSAQK
jgi:hypothetical protein